MRIIMATKYAYKQLTSIHQTIRLLYLEPAASEGDDLHGSLVPVCIDLEPAPAYEALSYAWGDPVFPAKLFLDGRGYHGITANLSQCLTSLRRVDTTRVLWVDAVCINQDDLREKEAQVALMGTIYKSATRALIWLGESSPNLEWIASLGNSNAAGGCAVTYRDGKRLIIWSENNWRPSTSSEDISPPRASHIGVIEAPPDAESFTSLLKAALQ